MRTGAGRRVLFFISFMALSWEGPEEREPWAPRTTRGDESGGFDDAERRRVDGENVGGARELVRVKDELCWYKSAQFWQFAATAAAYGQEVDFDLRVDHVGRLQWRQPITSSARNLSVTFTPNLWHGPISLLSPPSLFTANTSHTRICARTHASDRRLRTRNIHRRSPFYFYRYHIKGCTIYFSSRLVVSITASTWRFV